MAWRPQIIRTDGASGTSYLADEAEFLASEYYTVKRVGVTLDSSLVGADANGDKILKKGTVLSRVDATGRYAPYTNGGAGGRGTPKGFLIEAVNLKAGNVVTGMIISGSVIGVRCSGLDTSAETALNGQFTFQ